MCGMGRKGAKGVEVGKDCGEGKAGESCSQRRPVAGKSWEGRVKVWRGANGCGGGQGVWKMQCRQKLLTNAT